MPSLHAADALIVGVVLCSVYAPLVGEGDLDRVARLGLVRRDGDRQPLLARLHRRHRRRADRDGRGLQRPHPGRVCRSSGVTDRLPTRSESPARRRCYGPAREQSSRDQARLHVRSARPRIALGDRPHPHPGHPERPHGERRHPLRRRLDPRPLRRTGTRSSSTGSPRSSSSPARCSTSSTARSPAPAARRRRSARSSTRPPTASARASC